MTIEQDRTTITQFFALLGDGHIDEWLKLIDKDVRVTTPLAEKGSPTLFQGIDEVNARFGDARKGLEELLFYDIDLWQLKTRPDGWRPVVQKACFPAASNTRTTTAGTSV